jgi:hypothetical protein
MVANPTYQRIPQKPEGYPTFQAFYPFYLGEHSNATCRRLHIVGTTGVVALATAAACTLNPGLLLALPAVGYGMAWLGHFFFEHNRPATFKHPVYSLMGDFKMWWEVVSRQRAF